MKQILVDMDGVLADVYAQFQKYEKQETGLERPMEEIKGKLELDAFPNGIKHATTKGFFRNAPPIEGSKEGLNYLNKEHKVLIVSLATEYPDSLKEKVEWLNENYPFISWRQIFLCGDKSQIKGDLMIDDHPKNLDRFEGERILFTQPHNLFHKCSEYIRINNWEELINLF